MTPRPHGGRLVLRLAAAVFLLTVVGLPIAAVVADVLAHPSAAWRSLGTPAATASLTLTLWTAAVVTAANTIMGTLTAWVLVRYRFPGRALLVATVDLPLAVPTVVAGLMLIALYGPQSGPGAWLAAHGLRLLFAPPAILLALVYVTFPFVVRAVEPVLSQLDLEQEEAAFTLGAWPFAAFWHVTLPAIRPAVATAALLTFARALGEFGAVVVVAGNLPGRTLTAPVYVFGALESGQRSAASAMSTLLIALSLALLVVTNRYARARQRAREARA